MVRLRKGHEIPIITVTLAEGRSAGDIRTLIAALTEAVGRSIGAPKESIRVLIQEIPTSHWSAGDVTLAERAARREWQEE